MAKQSPRGKGGEKRRAFRHSAYVPIGISTGKGKLAPSLLHNISNHGLSFSVFNPLAPGTIVDILVPSVSRDFRVKAKIIWCHPVGKDLYRIGVSFLKEARDFNARLVQLVRRIERYRAEAAEKGHALTFEEATAEWIRAFAKILPV